MRFFTVFALVAACSAAVLAQTPLAASSGGSDSQYTPAPAPSVGPLETPAPVIEETPAPLAQETPAPVAQDASAPLVEETPAPAVEETPAPLAYETTAPAAQETPAPVSQDASAPLVEESPAPAVEETPAPLAYETPAPVAQETPAPVAQDASAPIVEETPAPAVEEASGEDPSYYRRAHRRQRQVTTTTTARPGSNATEESGNSTAVCAANAVCFHDEDCGSTGDKKGRCLGFFNGKCNCNACLNFLTCKDDSACGGLKGACNTTTSRCSCDEGYKANGFAAGFLDAFRELCNVKDCTGENHADACFGLPCNSGRCIC